MPQPSLLLLVCAGELLLISIGIQRKLDHAKHTLSPKSSMASSHSLDSCDKPFLPKSVAAVPPGLKAQGALMVLADFFELHKDWFDWFDSLDS